MTRNIIRQPGKVANGASVTHNTKYTPTSTPKWPNKAKVLRRSPHRRSQLGALTALPRPPETRCLRSAQRMWVASKIYNTATVV